MPTCEYCGKGNTDDRTVSLKINPDGSSKWVCIFCKDFIDPGTVPNINLARMGHILLEQVVILIMDS